MDIVNFLNGRIRGWLPFILNQNFKEYIQELSPIDIMLTFNISKAYLDQLGSVGVYKLYPLFSMPVALTRIDFNQLING